MRPFEKIIKKQLKNAKGFTLMELMIIIAIISVLASIAFLNYMPIRAKALDATAHTDARNLVESVINAIMTNEDVDYTKINTGGAVGDRDTSNNPRTPVFILSPGVAAVIIGDSIQAPNGNTTIFFATVYHTGGTIDPLAPSGRKEFTCFVDEDTGLITTPQAN